MNIAVLRDTERDIESRLSDIHTTAGDRSLNAAEQSRWDAAEAELRDVRDAIAAAEAAERKAADVAANRARWSSLTVGTSVSTGAYAAADVARMSRHEARDKALAILGDQGANRHLRSEQLDRVDGLLRSTANQNLNPDALARMIAVTESPAYRSGFQRLLVERNPVLSSAEADALRAYGDLQRAMNIGTPGSGGYGVPVLIDPSIVLTAQQGAHPVLDIARVETITTDEWRGVSSAGVSWSWDVEAEEVSDDAPTLLQPTVPVHAARGFVPYSIEVGQDYPGFAEELTRLLSEGYQDLVGSALVTGSGSDQPTGIVTALDANTNVEVVVTTDGTFSATDIDKAWTALPDRAKANATWLMSSDVESHIAAWGDAYGGRTVDLEGRPTTLRGRPLAVSSAMPAFTGTTGAANILVVGDFSRFLVAARAGMTVEVVPHLFGTTNNRPTGQRGLFAMARTGADSIDDAAFRLLQNQ